jgi:TonB family protein
MQGLNMKSSILAALVLLLVFSAFGQTFSPNWEKVPPSFNGNDFETIYDSLLLSRKFFQKNEFETTAKFNERVNNPVNIKLGGNLTAANTLVFVYKPFGNFVSDGLSAEYNADKEILSVKILTNSFDGQAGNTTDNRFLAYFGTAVKPSILKSDGSYIGENSFGVKRNIQKFSGNSFSLVVANISDFFKANYNSTPSLETELNLPPAQARLVKNNLAVAYFMQLTSPYYGIDITESKPTIDVPKDIKIYHEFLFGNVSEIWLFDAVSGIVYSKLNAKKILRARESELAEQPTPKVELPRPQPTPEPTPQPTPRIISKGVINGSAIQLAKPVYPAAAKAVGATGTVNIQVELDELGNVVSANAISGHPLLQVAALAAARQSKFAPTLLSGVAVRVTGIIVFVFH